MAVNRQDEPGRVSAEGGSRDGPEGESEGSDGVLGATAETARAAADCGRRPRVVAFRMDCVGAGAVVTVRCPAGRLDWTGAWAGSGCRCSQRWGKHVIAQTLL